MTLSQFLNITTFDSVTEIGVFSSNGAQILALSSDSLEESFYEEFANNKIVSLSVISEGEDSIAMDIYVL